LAISHERRPLLGGPCSRTALIARQPGYLVEITLKIALEKIECSKGGEVSQLAAIVDASLCDVGYPKCLEVFQRIRPGIVRWRLTDDVGRFFTQVLKLK